MPTIVKLTTGGTQKIGTPATGQRHVTIRVNPNGGGEDPPRGEGVVKIWIAEKEPHPFRDLATHIVEAPGTYKSRAPEDNPREYTVWACGPKTASPSNEISVDFSA